MLSSYFKSLYEDLLAHIGELSLYAAEIGNHCMDLAGDYNYVNKQNTVSKLLDYLRGSFSLWIL